MKDAAIRIRVEKQLRDAFNAACKAQNLEASGVLREFMQAYIERIKGGQGDLFTRPVRQQQRKRKSDHV